ncbi:MAG: hypothetical protein RXS42_00505 [Nitrososphaeria archaeon]
MRNAGGWRMGLESLIPGATAVGIAFKDGVVLAAEKRFAYGNFIVSRSGRKVFRIADGVGAAFAGMIGDMQVLVKYVQSLVKLKEVEELRPVSPRSVAKLMGVIMYEQRLTPMLTQVVLGGVGGGEPPEIYVLDPLGSVIPDRYASVGTGAETAISVIESGYREDLDPGGAVDLATRAIRAAILRDAASGDGVDIMVISGAGIEERSITFRGNGWVSRDAPGGPAPRDSGAPGGESGEAGGGQGVPAQGREGRHAGDKEGDRARALGRRGGGARHAGGGGAHTAGHEGEGGRGPREVRAAGGGRVRRGECLPRPGIRPRPEGGRRAGR